MNKTLKIESDFALLDVKKGRKTLSKVFDKNQNARIPVTICGFLIGQWGHDDGTSIEFEVEVNEAKLGRLPK